MSPSEPKPEPDADAPVAAKPHFEIGGAKNRSPGPRHFHLLWDEELEALRPMLKLVLKHLEEVIAHWYHLYVLHFGDQRALTEAEFTGIFQSALARNTQDLLDANMDRYAIGTIQIGELLCERNVPFSEVVVSLHLYE
jgi:hypothetical protein